MFKNWLRICHLAALIGGSIRRARGGKVARAAIAVVLGALLSGASPIDPDEGRPHVRWQDAERVAGRTAFVYGEIAKVGHASGIHFLNFDPERRDVFKLVVFDRSLDRFAGSLEDLYRGKFVRVRGVVSNYGGVPQIAISAPAQIQVLDALPALDPPRSGSAEVAARS